MATMQIPLCRSELFALIDEEDYPLVCRYNWTSSARGRHPYAKCNTHLPNGRFVTLTMHRLIVLGTQGTMVDHINMNTLDNRRCNLRLASKAQNMRNRGPTSRSTSGYKGVHWNKRANKWVAEIQVDGKHLYLGVFVSADEAAMVYNEAATRLHGAFARLNPISSAALLPVQGVSR